MRLESDANTLTKEDARLTNIQYAYFLNVNSVLLNETSLTSQLCEDSGHSSGASLTGHRHLKLVLLFRHRLHNVLLSYSVAFMATLTIKIHQLNCKDSDYIM